MNSSETSTTTVAQICSFLKKGLKSSNFTEWADINVYKLAKIYEAYRGVAYSVVDASHVLVFVQTVCSIADIEDTMDMTSQFIKCQFKDSIV